MAPQFGTSGLRGLVTELTDELCSAYAGAFLRVLPHNGTLLIGRDLRASSARISDAVIKGAHGLGIATVDCGELPTPALALAALSRGSPAVMVTGSHIPADRNGLKFYTAQGEITKTDEASILAALGGAAKAGGGLGGHSTRDAGPARSYMNRYIGCFGPKSLQGLRIGNYQHSSVARDILGEILRALGAQTVDLGRSDIFVPVDTEAVDQDTRDLLHTWTRQHRLDAIVSTDGDGDRPLVADETGAAIAGDVLGVLTALYLRAETVVTPVSSNTLIERMGAFARVVRTRIGSPHVIAAMQGEGGRCVGFEANGGFLLGFDSDGRGGGMGRLMTRDSLLPILAPLAVSVARKTPLSALTAELPRRFTASDRLQGVATDKSLALVARLADDPQARQRFFAALGPEENIDLTDGLRVFFASGDIVHLRPSGNAPELRCYGESDQAARAAGLVKDALARALASLR
ncbi:MAG: phosphomannomutase [Rhodobacteraceae bacterium]|nr:phosphomannomutase [Paracoccaceae bacterium]MCP5342898.1 phosphomannomutase [Paracoccaceae bacterium]